MANIQVEEALERVHGFEILSQPQHILLFSGKRKSGKDYITDALYKSIGGKKSTVLKLSGPIKTHWANNYNLDIDQLLSDGEYKEKYRNQMNKWGESIRKQDYGYFCRAAIDMYNAWDKPIWIISDARRETDIQWFMENFEGVCKTIRIVSSDEKRRERGWTFTADIDDAETECGLDDVSNWDLEVENNDDGIDNILKQILTLINLGDSS